MIIRDARIEEAEAICEVLRSSIIELCGPDHHDDPSLLGPWIENKTVAQVRKWLHQSDHSFLVATSGTAIAAVGAVTHGGLITLLYVAPAFRFRGVSRTLLLALEARALERGAARYILTSTETAHRFYRRCGYLDDADPTQPPSAKGSYRMLKAISACPRSPDFS